MHVNVTNLRNLDRVVFVALGQFTIEHTIYGLNGQDLLWSLFFCVSIVFIYF